MNQELIELAKYSFTMSCIYSVMVKVAQKLKDPYNEKLFAEKAILYLSEGLKWLALAADKKSTDELKDILERQ